MAVHRPAVRQVVEGHVAFQVLHRFDDVVLLQLGACPDRIGDVLARVGDQMLDLCQHASVDVGVAVAGNAAAGGAEAGEIVLVRIDVAPAAVALLVGEEIRLHRHLVECVVPPHVPALAVALVDIGDVGKARFHARVAALQEAHQALRSDAGRHLVLGRGADLRQAILTRVDMRCADLRGADLRGALLLGADLREALLEGVLLDGAIVGSKPALIDA